MTINAETNSFYNALFMMQSSLVEYNFRVTDIFEDLQDGVRLCRAIQLLQHDSSILLVAKISSLLDELLLSIFL